MRVDYVNEDEIQILNILKKELELRHPEYNYTTATTCDSYSTLFIDGLGMYRLAKMFKGYEIKFRLTKETKEKHKDESRFKFYNIFDEFWGICFDNVDFTQFDEFIEDTIINYKHLKELDRHRKEKNNK